MEEEFQDDEMTRVCCWSDGCEVTNLVFFPFGMGAFLRNLYKLDPEYAEDGGPVTQRENFRHREMVIRYGKC